MQVQFDELKNIINEIKAPPLISDIEYGQIVESAGILIHDMIRMDPMIYAHPTFSVVILHDTVEVLTNQLQSVFEFDIEEYVENATEDAISIYYTYICPPRSYSNSFIRIPPVIEKMTRKINYLKSVPQPEQRTTEWYHFRHKYLTASSLWKAFGTQRAQNELIYDKCRPIDVEKYKNVNTESPMHWGQKYEDVSLEWYNKQYNTSVSDFGCIPHRSISYLAASPDGINTDDKSQRYGRMVEVKNIVNRKIDGIPKMEYWIQMQLQMEVCELDECDFLETRFIEYDSAKEFYEDGDFCETKDGKPKGIIMFFNNGGLPLYEYLPFGSTEEEFEKWENEMMEKHKDITWVRNDYWRLDQVSCVLVLRNKMWFEYALPQLDKLWKTIAKERVDGYEHRAPNKNKKVKMEPKEMKCYIDVKNLLENEEINQLSKSNQACETENNFENKHENKHENEDDSSQNKVINISTESYK